MPKRTNVDGDTVNFRTRHLPVAIHERLLALAWTLGITEEELVNDCILLGLDYLEGSNDFLDSRE